MSAARRGPEGCTPRDLTRWQLRATKTCPVRGGQSLRHPIRPDSHLQHPLRALASAGAPEVRHVSMGISAAPTPESLRKMPSLTRAICSVRGTHYLRHPIRNYLRRQGGPEDPPRRPRSLALVHAQHPEPDARGRRSRAPTGAPLSHLHRSLPSVATQIPAFVFHIPTAAAYTS